jgi:transcriptional regulator MraZ
VASERFLGRYFHSIDDKARVAIPHKFRTILGGVSDNRVVVTLSPNPKYAYLDIYPADEWDAILERILAIDTDAADTVEEQETLFANYVHPAQELEIDKQGRILLPQEHRDFAGIEKEVVYTGDASKFRLWAKPEWERYDAAMRKARGNIRGIPRPAPLK